MNQQTVDLLRYAEHEFRWEPLQHDPKGKVTFPPKPERTFWDKLDALNFTPAVIWPIKAKGKQKKNPGPNHRVCLSCHAFIPDGMAKIMTPKYAKASENSQRAACPHCGGELSWQHN